MQFYIRYLIFALCFLLLAATYARAESPLIFVFQKQKDPEVIRQEAASIAAYLSQELNRKVVTQVPNDYAASVQALVSKKADIAYVDSMAFLLARRDAGASVLLAEYRPDTKGELRTEYDSIFVVAKDSSLETINDLVNRAPELRMVFTSPTSTSGYLMPYRRFVKEGLLQPKQDVAQVFKSISFGGSYTQALEQVLLGRADVAAVSAYTLEGQSAESYLAAEQREKLRILARTPGVPTHVIAARGGLPEVTIKAIIAAIKKLQVEHPALLADVYGASQFIEVEPEQHLQASIEAVTLTGLPVDGIVNKTVSLLQDVK